MPPDVYSKRESPCPRSNEDDNNSHQGCGEQGFEHLKSLPLKHVFNSISLSSFCKCSGLCKELITNDVKMCIFENSK